MLFRSLGTNYRQLLEAAGGPVGEPEKYISGGPMMGFAMYSLDVPVVKGSSSLLVFKEDVVSKLETSACIRCGRCGDGCQAICFLQSLQDLQAEMTKQAS